eukprot:7009483-Lingulodinium_polyedra.AAC.1
MRRTCCRNLPFAPARRWPSARSAQQTGLGRETAVGPPAPARPARSAAPGRRARSTSRSGAP